MTNTIVQGMRRIPVCEAMQLFIEHKGKLKMEELRVEGTRMIWWKNTETKELVMQSYHNEDGTYVYSVPTKELVA
jgi:hypothetical protein